MLAVTHPNSPHIVGRSDIDILGSRNLVCEEVAIGVIQKPADPHVLHETDAG